MVLGAAALLRIIIVLLPARLVWAQGPPLPIQLVEVLAHVHQFVYVFLLLKVLRVPFFFLLFFRLMPSIILGGILSHIAILCLWD